MHISLRSRDGLVMLGRRLMMWASEKLGRGGGGAVA